MVQRLTKLLAYTLLTLFTVIATGTAAGVTEQASRPLKILWQDPKPASCQHLVESFVAELRAIATDRIIELDMLPPAKITKEGETPKNDSIAESRPVLIWIRCAASPNLIETTDGSRQVPLHFLTKAGSFDATDWLAFQQRFLRVESLSLAQLAPSATPLDAGFTESAMLANAASHPSLFNEWWFWTGISALAAAAYVTGKAIHNAASSSVNVAIQ